MNTRPTDGDMVTRLEKAADWLLALQNAPSGQTRKALEAWLAETPANRQAFEEVQSAWQQSGYVAASPTIAAARADARRAKSRPVQPPRLVHRVAGMALAAMVVLAAGILLYDARLRPPAIYETAVGEIREIRLADASGLYLNTATRVRVDYSLWDRRVQLDRGQVFVDVAHNPDKPFIVTVNDIHAKALGTAFEVHKKNRTVRVAVHEGLVEVAQESAAFASANVTPGEFVDIVPRAATPHPRPLKSATTPAWLEGRIEFDDETLEDAVSEFNRYSETKIKIADPALRSFRLSGAFDVTEQAAFLTAVHTLTGARIRESSPPGLIWIEDAATDPH